MIVPAAQIMAREMLAKSVCKEATNSNHAVMIENLIYIEGEKMLLGCIPNLSMDRLAQPN